MSFRRSVRLTRALVSLGLFVAAVGVCVGLVMAVAWVFNVVLGVVT